MDEIADSFHEGKGKMRGAPLGNGWRRRGKKTSSIIYITK